MDKKTLLINLVLIVLICAIGIGFASYVVFSNSKPIEQKPSVDVFVFDSNQVLNQVINQYDLDFSLNHQGNDYFYSGSVDVLKKQCNFVDNHTDEVVEVSYCDFYSVLQKNIPARTDWEGDNISFPVLVEKEKAKGFFDEFFGLSFSQPLNCEISVSDTGYILDSVCTSGNLKVNFSFFINET